MNSRRGDHRGGYILVAVLSVMLLLTGFMAAGSLVVRSALNTAKVGDDDVAMAGLTRSGIEISAYQLFVLELPPNLVDGRRIKLTGGTVRPAVIDEGAKIDLNASDPKVLQSLFESVGIDQRSAMDAVTRLLALRGDAGKAQAGAPGSPGATAPQPGSQQQLSQSPQPQPQTSQAPGEPQKKRRRGIQSLDDLSDFPEFTRDDIKALRPMLTVYNPDGKIDVLTASPDVLAVLPGLTKPRVEEILARRDSLTKETLQQLDSTLGDAKNFTKTDPGPAYSVHLEAVSEKGRKKIVDVVLAASKSANDPYYVLDWRD